MIKAKLKIEDDNVVLYIDDVKFVGTVEETREMMQKIRMACGG